MTGYWNAHSDRDWEDQLHEEVPLCPVTHNPCTGLFCEDYGCAKEAGFFDGDGDEEDY